jgi:hypothetical protein
MSKKNTRKAITDIIKLRLWTISGGRCQFKGCNDYLLKDDLTYAGINNAHIAHIVDVNPKTHRYKESTLMSEDKKNEIENLMLLCQKHHRLIDNEEEKNYSIEKLEKVKKEHENRILNLTSIKGTVKTTILLYSAKIGEFHPSFSFENLRYILSKKDLYPNSEPIEISSRNTFEDNKELYWTVEEENLTNDFNKKILTHFDDKSINHFSLFALAPQPLLIKLGTLIPNIYTVDVYQKHRTPDTWEWQVDKGCFSGFTITKPDNFEGKPVLKIALSATITDDRIYHAMEGDLSIWTLTIDNPNTGFLIHPEILEEFKTITQFLFNLIKEKHGHKNTLSVFPSMPVSASVEFGRVWMPKADLSLDIYDERTGFKRALTINRKN